MTDSKISDEGDKCYLVSSEGDKFEVSMTTAAESELVKTMFVDPDSDCEDEDEDESKQQIPLPNVKSAVLAKVVEFCDYHVKNGEMKQIEKPLKSANMAENVGEWDANYIEVTQEMLFELLLAANYMDIKSLLDLASAKIASMIKGKDSEEIRKTFNIINDFTPAEEAQVREENKWCEEA